MTAHKANRRIHTHRAQPRPSRQDLTRHHESPFSRDVTDLRDGVASFDAVRFFPLLPRLPRLPRRVGHSSRSADIATRNDYLLQEEIPTTSHSGFFSADAVQPLFIQCVDRPFSSPRHMHRNRSWIFKFIRIWHSTETITSPPSKQMVLIYPTRHSIGFGIIDYKTSNMNFIMQRFYSHKK